MPTATGIDITLSKQLTMSTRDIAELTSKRHADVMRDVRVMLDGLELGQRKFAFTYLDVQGKSRECYNLPKDFTLTLVSGYNVKLRKKIIDRWMELERAECAPDETPEELAHRALTVLNDTLRRKNAEIATLEPKALAFDSLINNGELPSLRTFFKQFHELNLTAIPATLGELGYLRRSDRYVGQWEVRRSHPRAAELFRQRIKDGIRWQQITILLTPQGQEEMARLYRQGAFPKLARFSH